MSEPIGSGKWSAAIYERGGARVVSPLKGTTPITAAYVLDDTSEASLSVPNNTMCDVLSIIEPFRHELVLFRDEDLGWNGIPSYPQWTPDVVTLAAADLSSWLDHRVVSATYNFSNEPLSVIFQTLFEDAFIRDASPNLHLDLSNTAAGGSRLILESERRIVADELRELVRTGLDFTTIGRTLIVMDPATTPILPGVLITEHIEVESYGQIGPYATTESFWLGELNGIEGRAGGVSAAYGLVQSVRQESRIRDVVSAQDAAANELIQTQVPPYQLICKLRKGCPFAFRDLVPGVVIQVRCLVGCKPVQDVMRLVQVDITDDGTEQITLTLLSEVRNATPSQEVVLADV